MKRALPRQSQASASINKDLWWAGWQLEIVRFNQKQAGVGPVWRADDNDQDDVSIAHEAVVDDLRAQLAAIETQLRESQSQRAILESVISDRLASERKAVTNAETMKAALRTVTGRVTELNEERERERLFAQRQREVRRRVAPTSLP